jgi:hypothetical protein
MGRCSTQAEKKVVGHFFSKKHTHKNKVPLHWQGHQDFSKHRKCDPLQRRIFFKAC